MKYMTDTNFFSIADILKVARKDIPIIKKAVSPKQTDRDKEFWKLRQRVDSYTLAEVLTRFHNMAGKKVSLKSGNEEYLLRYSIRNDKKRVYHLPIYKNNRFDVVADLMDGDIGMEVDMFVFDNLGCQVYFRTKIK